MLNITLKKLKKRIIKAIPDSWYCSFRYFRHCRQIINWRKPEGYNQKIQWIKRYYHNPLMTVCADKYEVRKYVAERLGETVLIKLLGVWDKAEEVDFDSLPDKFILKATHGCHMNLICHDKKSFDTQSARQTMNRWLARNYYETHREWHYCDIPPRIIAEELIADNELTKEYRIFCFHGKPQFVRLVYGISGNHEYERIYTTDWTPLENTWHYRLAEKLEDKPVMFDNLLDAASKLSTDFPTARIDLYNPDDRILFGEITLTPGAGMQKSETYRPLDDLFGEYLILPEQIRS